MIHVNTVFIREEVKQLLLLSPHGIISYILLNCIQLKKQKVFLAVLLHNSITRIQFLFYWKNRLHTVSLGSNSCSIGRTGFIQYHQDPIPVLLEEQVSYMYYHQYLIPILLEEQVSYSIQFLFYWKNRFHIVSNSYSIGRTGFIQYPIPVLLEEHISYSIQFLFYWKNRFLINTFRNTI